MLLRNAANPFYVINGINEQQMVSYMYIDVPKGNSDCRGLILWIKSSSDPALMVACFCCCLVFSVCFSIYFPNFNFISLFVFQPLAGIFSVCSLFDDDQCKAGLSPRLTDSL